MNLSCSDAGRPGDECHPYRIGGYVVSFPWAHPISRSDLIFGISDGCLTWPVHYEGLPGTYRLIRPGAFVVAEGSTSINGEFYSAFVYVDRAAQDLHRRMHETDMNYVAACRAERQDRSRSPK
jgi:cytochrome c-type biogenesis protein CcmE